MMSGAGVMGILQTIIVILLLSTTAVLLERSHSWKSQLETYPARGEYTTQSTTLRPIGVSPLPTTTQIVNHPPLAVWQEDGEWRRDSGLTAFLEIHLAHHVAFYSFWLLCLILFALAFKLYRPELVLPNLIMQVVGLALMMILAGLVIAKLVLLCRQYDSMASPAPDEDGYVMALWQRDDINVRYAFYAILLGVLVIGLVAEVIFIWISIDFYRYLRDTYHTRSVHHGRDSPPHHGGYHRHIEPLREETPKQTTIPVHHEGQHVTTTVIEPAGGRVYT